MIQLLLNKGADINAQGGYYDSALQIASFQGNEAVIRLLLNEGADANTSSSDGLTALHIAAANGH